MSWLDAWVLYGAVIMLCLFSIALFFLYFDLAVGWLRWVMVAVFVGSGAGLFMAAAYWFHWFYIPLIGGR